MTRRTAAALGAIVVACGLSLVGAPAASADSATVSEVGWWTKRPGAGALPDGGFEVSNGLDGAQSVAALRLAVDGSPSSVTLRLAESSGLVSNLATFQVCGTSATWAAANPGALADAPAADCGSPAPLTRGTDGTWTADVTGLVGAGSLMVVPAPVAGLPIATLSQVTFAGATAGVTTAPPSTVPPTSESTGPTVTPPVNNAAPLLPSLTPPSFSAPPIAAPAGATPPAATTPTTLAAAPFTPVAATGGGRGGKPWGRLVFMVPLSALGGLAAARGRRFLVARGVTAAPG